MSLNVSSVFLEALVQDALTGLTLDNAEITYENQAYNQNEQIVFGTTDDNGKCAKSVIPGEYKFIASKTGYYNKELVINTESEKRTLEFKLIIH